MDSVKPTGIPSLYAIVSLLDPDHHARVCDLWEELNKTLGIRCLYPHPLPHFSYHVAAAYDPGRLIEALQGLGRRMSTFKIRTTGLGLFTGPHPILYIPLTRTAELTAFHAEIWETLAEISTNPVGYYHPQHWIPHITLAYDNVTHEQAGAAIQQWAGRSFEWEITIDNLTLLCSNCGNLEMNFRVDLLQ